MTVASPRVAWSVLALGLAVLAATGADAASPHVVGPVAGGTRGFPFGATAVDLAAAGYVEEEFFVEGTAHAFTASQPLSPDGAWQVERVPHSAELYRTRILVRRPARVERFSGSVVVEWLNVSGGGDNAADWAFLYPLLLAEGHAWVGVSAQEVGVAGFPEDHPRAALGNAGALTVWDAERYASLRHPGDSFSYDLFAQVGAALRSRDGVDPLGGLTAQRLIAVGMSQSAARLTTYIDAVQPLEKRYDGFLVHARGGRGAPLSETPQADIPAPLPTRLRTDLDTPVLTFETETDLVVLGFHAARQPDDTAHRLWEVAGSAHTDVHQMRATRAEASRSIGASRAGLTCDRPGNAGPQGPVLRAAFHHLERWVRDGSPPPRGPRLVALPGDPARIVRDGRGNALGGIRTPDVDVPVAMHAGEGNLGGLFCNLLGVTEPFEAETLALLYPSRDAYLAAVDQSLEDAVAAGHLLAADAAAIRAAAERFPFDAR